MTDDDFAKWCEQHDKRHDEETLIRSKQRLTEIGFAQHSLLGDDTYFTSNCQVRVEARGDEWEIIIHLPDDSWIRTRTGKLYGRTRAEIDVAMERLRLEAEERRRKAEAEPRITLAGTMIPFEDGTWGVTLNDYMADMDEVSTIQTFDNKEAAEAFAAEVRKARDELP